MKVPWEIISVPTYSICRSVSLSYLASTDPCSTILLLCLVLDSFLWINICFIIPCFIIGFLFFPSLAFPRLEVNAVSFWRLMLSRPVSSWELYLKVRDRKQRWPQDSRWKRKRPLVILASATPADYFPLHSIDCISWINKICYISSFWKKISHEEIIFEIRKGESNYLWKKSHFLLY